MAKATIPKKKVMFQLQSPEAREVLLAGDFTDWDKEPLPLKKGKNGTWQKQISLPCGLYEYRFIVDGQWVTDPKAQERHTNPFGTENAVVVVMAGGADAPQ